ncbi:MAG: M56 family metallopeptidase [Kangiellaceae bacterium]|jgi:bla regulator protein blaR1
MDVLVGFVSSQEVTNLALTLIHFIWQGAIIAAGLWFALVITPRNNFQLRYRSAVFALILCIVSPIATFSFLSHNPSVSQANLTQVSQLKSNVADSLNNSNSGLSGPISESSNPVSIQAFADPTDYLGYVLLAWLLGCVFMSFKFILDLNRTFRLTREGVAKVSNRVENIVNSLSVKYRLKRKITILKSRKVNVPVVIGWLRPVVLLPIAITIGLETKHLELIIAHELAHIKRMDFAVNLFQSIVQICLFYHPVIYWINKVIRDEREYICDQLALEVLGNDESAKINLAKALLGTEELREGNLSLVAVAASGGMLKHRISHILDSQYKPATSLKSLFIGTMVFLFSFAALSTTFELNDKNVVSSAKIELTEKLVNTPNTAIVLRDELVNISNKNSEKTNTGPSTQNVRRVPEGSDDLAAHIQAEKELKSNATNVLVAQDANIETSNSAKIEKISTSVAAKTRSKQSEASNMTGSSKVLNSKPASAPADLQIRNKSPREKSSKIGSSAKINDALFRELSSKALTDQYLLPAAAVSDESRLLKTAALDLQSITSFKEPKAIFTPYPKYPRRAWDKMINQTIRVNFSITSEGDVSNIDIMEDADEAFSDEIYRRLRNWKYRPAEKDGVRVAHLTSLEFVFKAPQKKPIPTITTGSRIRRR